MESMDIFLLITVVITGGNVQARCCEVTVDASQSWMWFNVNIR
jgi:hypothetical protein